MSCPVAMEDEKVNLEKQTGKALKKLDCVDEGSLPSGILFFFFFAQSVCALACMGVCFLLGFRWSAYCFKRRNLGTFLTLSCFCHCFCGILNSFKYGKICFMDQYLDYLHECYKCTLKDCVYCSCWVNCSINSN